MSLKFGKTMKTLRLSQNYLVLVKMKSVKLSTTWLLLFRPEVANKKPLFRKPAST